MPQTNITRRTRRAGALVGEGLPRGDLRRTRWVHPMHGIVRPSGMDESQPDTCVADAIGLLTPGCAVGGWASRWLQGGAFADGLDPAGHQRDVLIHCPPGSQLRRRPGIKPFQGQVLPGESVEIDGVLVTTLARATFDEMRMGADLREAVVALDLAISVVVDQPRASLTNVGQVIAHHHKVRGRLQSVGALEWASLRVASPWETRTRLIAVLDAGIKEWLVNVPIFDRAGCLLGVADLLHRASGLVLESDGAGHRDETKHVDDNLREEKFERCGLTVVRIAASDHRVHMRPRTVARICSAYDDACHTPNRGWTLEAPAWWYDWPPARRWH